MTLKSDELRTVLLQEIVAHGPGHGGALYDRLVERGHPNFLRAGKPAGAWKAAKDRNSIYPVLRDLESEGLLSTRRTEPMPERGGRPRIVYFITELGLKAARQPR